ncbi:MAG: hypothetical protein FJW23_10445 [Acidimicrobiia bacterium]|nr:hypothetical protein [Acidimicrobiia bacterium]
MSVPALKQRLGRWLFPRLPITRALFDQLRFEGNAIRVRAAYACLPWRRARLRAVRRRRGVLVNIACGPHRPAGFLNLDLLPASPDVMPWDCRRSIPLSAGSAAGVRAEQFVEHLDPREEAPAFLADVVRALAPGGVLRIVVPDAARFMEAYGRADRSGFDALAVPDPFPGDLPTKLDVVNHVFHQWGEHRWAYDFETLEHRLRRAGFSRVEQQAFEQSLDPRLACDRSVHAPYSLYVDAVK